MMTQQDSRRSGMFRFGYRKMMLIMVSVIAIAIVACAVTVIATMRGQAAEMRTSGRLTQLGSAFQLYIQQNKTLPPAYTVDQNGTPMHSWRVLMLPYLDEAELYSRIDLLVPWNHPKNLELAEQFPGVASRFQSGDSYRNTHQSLHSNFFAVVGKTTLWPGQQPIDEATLRVGMDKMIIVEDRHAVSHWMNPVDLTITQLDTDPTYAIQLPCHVLRADGYVCQYTGDMLSMPIRNDPARVFNIRNK